MYICINKHNFKEIHKKKNIFHFLAQTSEKDGNMVQMQ